MKVLPPFAAVSKTRKALGRDALVILQELRRGNCKAFETSDGVAIVRPDFPDLVIVAYEGKNALDCFDYWFQIAKTKGYGFVRFHSSRPGMAKLAKGRAIESETIFISEVK